MFRNPSPHVLYLYFSSAIAFVLDCSTLDCTHRSTDRTAFAEKKSGNPRQEVCWVRWNFLLLGSKNVAFRVAQPVSDRRAYFFARDVWELAGGGKGFLGGGGVGRRSYRRRGSCQPIFPFPWSTFICCPSFLLLPFRTPERRWFGSLARSVPASNNTHPLVLLSCCNCSHPFFLSPSSINCICRYVSGGGEEGKRTDEPPK